MITDEQIAASQKAYARTVAKQDFSNDIKLTGFNTEAMKVALEAYEKSKWEDPETAPIGERRLIEVTYFDDSASTITIAAKAKCGDWEYDNGYFVSEQAQYVVKHQPLPQGDEG